MVRVAWLALAGCLAGCTGSSPGTDGVPDDTGIDPASFIEGSEKRIDGTAESVDTEAEGTRMCVLDSGAVVVAWIDFRGGRTRVQTRTSPNGVAWPVPVEISNGNKPVANVDLACHGEVAVAVWEDQRDGDVGNPAIYTATSDPGGETWAAERRLAGDGEGVSQHREPRLAVGGDGTFHAVWYEDGDGAFDIYTARSTDGGASFGAAVRLDGGNAGDAWSAHPVVEADADGNVLVAWEDLRNGVVDIYAAMSTDAGATWGSNVRLDGGDADSYAPWIALGGGQAYVTWHDERDGAFLEVYAAHLAESGWTEPFRLREGPAGESDMVLPQAVLVDGLLNAVWFEAIDGGYHVMHAHVRDGVLEGPALRLDNAPRAAQTSYPLVVAQGDHQVVAWRDDRDAQADGDNRLYYVHSQDGGLTWSDDLRVDSAADGQGYAIDLDLTLRDGIVHAAWCDGRPAFPGVYVARFSMGDAAPFAP